MRIKFLVLPLAIYTQIASAQTLRNSISQTFIGLTAYSIQQIDPVSFTGNQAALAKTEQGGTGIFGERRFMLKETSVYTLAASLPTRLGNIGMVIKYAGFKNFRESRIGLAYARTLGKLVDIGIQFNYFGYSIPAYGKSSVINFEIGAIMHLTDRLNAGVHVYNPVGSKAGKSGTEKLPSSYKVGLGYDASDRFFIGTEIIKEEDRSINILVGFQYMFAKAFFAKAGIISESGTVYAGAGVSWRNMRLDISSSYHPQLGFSPGILLVIAFKAKAS